MYSEKRSDLEEQQLHLNVGLNKIAETVEQVEEMQKSLAVKSQELQAKNEAANSKLKQMFKDQQEAEKKKVQSQEIQLKLADQTVKIEEKRKFVMADLALVEPAVLDAQQGNVFLFFQLKIRRKVGSGPCTDVWSNEIILVFFFFSKSIAILFVCVLFLHKFSFYWPLFECSIVAVSGIKKKQLSEVRSMANPPAIVKLALESMCLLLNATDDSDVIPDWKTIRSILNKDSFIPSIINFDTASITYDTYIQINTDPSCSIYFMLFVSLAFSLSFLIWLMLACICVLFFNPWINCSVE